VLGIRKLLLDGAALYRKEAENQETLRRYGHGTPNDWIERNLYTRHKQSGIVLMLLINLGLFGVAGLTVWAVQMIWIPFWAAGVINGLGHWWGYRNYESRDASTNISPWGLWIGGEELHNNHHAFPSSARFSTKWWELDIGWFYIRTLSLLGLAKIKKVAPKPRIEYGKERVDVETLRAVIVAHLHVMANYAKYVSLPVLKEALSQSGGCRRTFRKAKALLVREPNLLDEKSRHELETVLNRNSQLKTVYSFRLRLQEVWGRAATSHDTLVQALKEWCAQAEATGIKSLQDFSRMLRGYSLNAAS
jgi:stearoyl-CoA desaturase (delta-9 desaturase)